MTITSQTTKVVAFGDGVTTVFAYDFLIPNAASVEVIYTDLSGVDTTLLPSQYSITGLGEDVGGTVTYPLSGSPIAVGTTLTINRDAAIVQLTSLNNQGGFYPEAVEGALDYLTILLQQLGATGSRALVAPANEPDEPLVIPTIAQRALQLLGFDADGLPIAASAASAPVSSAMQPVVAASTLALGRTAFGLGAIATEGIGTGLADDGASKVRVLFPLSSVSTAQAPATTDHMRNYYTTASVTFTLARANTYFNGFGFFIDNRGGTATIAINVNDQITGTTASGQSLTVPTGYRVFIYTDAAGSGTWYLRAYPTFVAANALDSLAQQALPGGRLTLTTATPVLSSDVTAATTVYYTPYLSGRISIYNGSAWVGYTFTELSQALSDNSKSPAAAAANSVYDFFVWDDNATLRCTRGPLWSSATARGTGAGTTELVYQNGMLVNNVAITNGPAAKRGTYVGTIATNGSTQLAMTFKPAAAAGGSANRLDMWNMYNRVEVGSVERDSANSWTYGTASWRAQNNNANNSVTFVRGLDDDAISSENYQFGITGAGTEILFSVGLGLDSTTALVDGCINQASVGDSSTGLAFAFVAKYNGYPGLGRHNVAAIEYVSSSGTVTFYGDNGGVVVQAGLMFKMRM